MDAVKWILLGLLVAVVVGAVVTAFGGVARFGTDSFTEVVDGQYFHINSPSSSDGLVRHLLVNAFTAELYELPAVWSMIVAFMGAIGALIFSFFAYKLARAVFG